MKVLVILDPTVPISKYNTVGSTNATCQLVKELNTKGLDITLGGNWDNLNCDMSNYSHPLNIYPEESRVYMKKAFAIINDHLENNHYDSIFVNISTPSAAKYLKDLNNRDIPVYFCMHSWTGTTGVSFYHKNDFIELIDNHKVNFIFLCESQMKTLFDNVERSPQHYVIEPNAILAEKYNISEDEARLYVESVLPEKFINEGFSLSVCRLVKSKHPGAIVDIAKNSHHNIVIVGDKWLNDLDYADETISEIESTDHVFWIKNLPNEDVIKLMKVANCTILFTDMEVCNLTVLESCIVGTPIVFGPSNDTGITDTINNLNGEGVFPIELPYRTKWNVKRDYLINLIDKASKSKYDVSKFPDCYKWNNHVDRYYKILTNQEEFN